MIFNANIVSLVVGACQLRGKLRDTSSYLLSTTHRLSCIHTAGTQRCDRYVRAVGTAALNSLHSTHYRVLTGGACVQSFG